MKSIRILFTLLGFVTLGGLACSITLDLGTLPGAQPTRPISGLDQVATMVAQTFQAQTLQASSATPTASPTVTATATAANTPAPVTLTVGANTNCRAGPGTDYGLVITLHPGTIVTVIGKDTLDNYWIIAVPNYAGTYCWIAGQYAAVSGDTGNLAEVPTPYVPYSYTLDEPSRLRVSCHSQTILLTPPPPSGHNPVVWTVVFNWKNTDPDQTGIRVYRNGHRIATLGAHANSITDVVYRFRHHEGVTYGVQAFNSSEVSSIVTIDVDHC